ncbi:MAG: EAL domain-containing protein [Pseudomonadota bacterium]
MPTELARAIANDELRLDYQPKIDLGTGTVTGVEALVRWQHPTRGRLGPDSFHPRSPSRAIRSAISPAG